VRYVCERVLLTLGEGRYYSCLEEGWRVSSTLSIYKLSARELGGVNNIIGYEKISTFSRYRAIVDNNAIGAVIQGEYEACQEG
jgi:hypothetical protein